MKFVYKKQELQAQKAARENTFLLCNGLGGYCSVSGGYSAPRADQGILVAAVNAPNQRISMVQHLHEALTVGGETACLSAQEYADNTSDEDGLSRLCSFSVEYAPRWEYGVLGVRVIRQCAIGRGENTTAVVYEIVNDTAFSCELTVTPLFKFAPKEAALEELKILTFKDDTVFSDNYILYVHTDGLLAQTEPAWHLLSYPEDAKDGRPGCGYSASCCHVTFPVQPGEIRRFEIVFSTERNTVSG